MFSEFRESLVWYLPSILENFQALLLQIFVSFLFCLVFTLPVFNTFFVVFHSSWILFFLKKNLFLYWNLRSFYWHIFKFMHYFSAVKSVLHFCFSALFSSSFFWFLEFFISLHILHTCSFILSNFSSKPLSILIVSILSSHSDNFKTSTNFKSASYACFIFSDCSPFSMCCNFFTSQA